MPIDTLIAELETIPHVDRVKRLIAIGRQSLTDPESAALLQDLAVRGTFYDRVLVLLSASGSHDGSQILLAISDESRLLRHYALKLAPDICSDAQVLSLLGQLPRTSVTLLLRGLLRSRRRDLIDTYLQGRTEIRDAQFASLLSFGSEEIVRQYLPNVLPLFGMREWSRLARLHPDIAVAAFQEQLQKQTESDARLVLHFNSILPRLAIHRPEGALSLLRALLVHEPPARFELQRLAEARPNAVADLLLENEDGGAARIKFDAFAHQLSEDRLLALLERRPRLLSHHSKYLVRLPPVLRRKVFELAGRGWETPEGQLDTTMVSLLPGKSREIAARRNLALPALASRTEQRLAYAAFLPWDEAHTVLDPFIRNPDADLRKAALSALIGVARFHRDRLTDVLALVRSRANEQDPVRGGLLSALASLPPSRWKMEHLADIAQIASDALAASDLSQQTTRYLEELIIGLLPFHPEWAATQLAAYVKSRGQLFSGLGDRLTDADTRHIAPALLPILQAWKTQEREHILSRFAQSMGRRLRAFQAFAKLLEQILLETRNSYAANQILIAFSNHLPDRFAAIVPRLVGSDPSAITLPHVHCFLHRHRQDLLEPFLGCRAYSGRFGTGKTRFVLPVSSEFHRWTASRQQIFALVLTEVTAENTRDTPAKMRAMDQLAGMMAVPPSRLIELAGAETSQPELREKALRLLSRWDGGAGIPVLIEALGDDRARIAIYALRSTLKEMPAARALEFLRNVTSEKVTVGKEVVRLLSELETPDAYPALLEMARRTPPLHRDVRIALLRAVGKHVERDETWLLLGEAAADPDPAVAKSVADVPADHLSPLAQERLLGLLATLLRRPETVVRMAVLKRCASLPLADRYRVMLSALLACLGSTAPDERVAAATAVFRIYTGTDASGVGDAIRHIQNDRSALRTSLSALKFALIENRSRLEPTVRAALAALDSDPLTVLTRAELAIAGLPWPEMAAYLSRLATRRELHAEALIAAANALQVCTRTDILPRRPAEDPPANGLAILEGAFVDSEDDFLRRLALAALLAQSRLTPGWTPALRTRLESYRRDPSPLIAAAAQFTFPPPDEDGRQ